MTLQQLKYLCEVARRGLNISKTAEALHISQPGLSRQLRLLEEELGLELFVRNSKRLVRLSEAGGRIVGIAERTLKEAQNITEAARESADDSSGILTIATTHTQARYALPAVIRRFAKQFPRVRLNLRQGTPGEVSQLVLSGNADISIAAETVDPVPGMVMLACYPLPRIVLTPARHPLLRVKQLTLEKLAEYPLITYDFSFIARSKIVRAFEAKGLTPNVVLNAIDADVIKTYVEFGLGIAVVPRMAFDAKRDRALRAIDASHLFEPNTIHVGIRQNHYLRGYTYAFIEMFAAHLTRARVEQAIRDAASRNSSGAAGAA
ncbi:MAG: CysB family HTH-type transcriptional regulator [Betaproteobacteria bacterium]|nr:CysB family HTH-type transcriptional regulator [Betaproteobacteria bacterium]